MPSSNFLTDRSKAMLLLSIFFVIYVFMFAFAILSCLFLAASWSPAGKGLTSWLSCMRCFLVFLSLFPYYVLSQVWYLIVLIPDVCLLSNFAPVYFLLPLYLDLFF